MKTTEFAILIQGLLLTFQNLFSSTLAISLNQSIGHALINKFMIFLILFVTLKL